MRIAIDGRIINEAGVGRYIRNLVSELQKLDYRNEYFILLLKKDFEKLKFKSNFNKVLADFHWYGISEQIKLPKLLKSLNLDLVHFPLFNMPLLYSGKFVVTIHDLIHQHFNMQRATTHGSLIYKLKQLGYKKVFANAIKKSQKILVPSNFVKNQLINDWEVDEKKIVVTYEAVDNNIVTAVSIMKQGNPIDTPYIFYVGNAHPHKNVEGLIKSFLKLKINRACDSKIFKNLKLILAGHDHYFWQRIKKEFRDDGIIYKGYVSDDKLVTLYKNALCFVMPSFEEGFGIPILEAMACSCPVVSSNAGSLPEVGGNACLYFDPSSPDDMAEKINLILNSEKLRKDLMKKGLKRYKLFSWQKLAEQTLEVYKQCA